MHKFIALLNELKISPLNTPDDSKLNRRTAAGRNDQLNLSVLQRGIIKANSPRAAKPLVLRTAIK